jgi:hypothetical protein
MKLRRFEIIGPIDEIETIAVGGRIKEIMRLRKQFGPGRWRKLKGIAQVQLEMAQCARLKYTGTRPMERAGRK